MPHPAGGAGQSLLELPAIRDSSWSALVDAMTADADADVRASMWLLLNRARDVHERRFDDAEEFRTSAYPKITFGDLTAPRSES
jgi:hypothetical protein